MTYSLHPQAAQDLADALAFYQRNASAQVAGRFLQEFERVAELLVLNPGFGTPFDLPRRIYPLRTFPYLVVYRPTEGETRILAVCHERRAPGLGQSRS